MTPTSAKPADQTYTNGHNLKSPTNGYVGGHTTPSREELIPDTNSIESAPLPSPKPQQQPKPVPVWRRLFPGWSNISIRSKLALLLMSGAAVPVIAVTQGLVLFSQHNAQRTLEETLHTRTTSFREDYTLWYKGETVAQAYSIAKTIESTRINLQNPQSVELNRPLLQFLVSVTPQEKLRPDAYKSLKIITDAQGKTIEQNIENHVDYPFGDSPKSEEILQPVSLPTGINLGDVPIIKDALRTGRPLSGIELLEGKFMQRLGLDKQATVSLRPQSSQGLSQSDQPFPEGTYPDIDRGKAGLVSMGVQPIKVEGKMVGVAVVATLLNKHHSLVDTFTGYFNTSASLFAKDLQVSTTVPYGNSKNRALGTRAPREVAEVVLNQGQEFFGQTDINGQKYLTGYSPLYDHQKELNPKQAKPVGMTFVAITPETVERTVGRLQLIGYSIGGGILLLAGLVAIPVAGTFSGPIRRLAGFAQQVGEGKQGVRLESTSRRDEIGVLSQELNQMAQRIEVNLVAIRNQEELRRQEAQRQRQEKEALRKRALELLMEVEPISSGDLTIRANVTEDEIGTIADSYNATVASLRKIVAQVQAAAQQVAATTSTSTQSVQGLSKEALRQTEEIAAALNRIQEMSNSIRAVAANAQQAEAAVQQATQTVEAGDAAMNRTVEGIVTLRETVAETSIKVQRLGESSQKISKVVKLIGTFAAQTNLLALKASIEAARAGEEGRGFAVLADEVRSLASQSAQATAEIESLVAAIQTETSEVVAAMEAGTEQVVTGTKLVDETRQSLNKITAASAQIAALVEAIAQAAVAQSQASEEVTQTISGVAAIANQTSNEATQVSASFKELLAVATELQASAGQFKVS